MAETMTGRDYYIQTGYDELPEAVRIEMRRVYDTGVNNSGVWVRYREVENLAGVMAYAYTHRVIRTNADRIRAMSNEELAELIAEGCCRNIDCPKEFIMADGLDCRGCWLHYLQSPVNGSDGDG